MKEASKLTNVTRTAFDKQTVLTQSISSKRCKARGDDRREECQNFPFWSDLGTGETPPVSVALYPLHFSH